MANARRVKRLEQMILETAATHVLRELSDPRIRVVSITRVKLAPDLTQAQIYWSCLGDEGTVRTTERGLQDALGSIQRAVAGALQTRTTPRLELRHDQGMVHAQRLEEIFTQLREERGDDPGDTASDTASDSASEAGSDAGDEQTES